MGGAETGFFTNTSLQPSDSVKNPVSSIGVGKFCEFYCEVVE